MIVDYCQKIDINDLVVEAKKQLKVKLVQSQIETLGVDIALATTKTRFNGERIWLVCPNCKRRSGTLYKNPLNEAVGCRLCLNLFYFKQRYKGMAEQIMQ